MCSQSSDLQIQTTPIALSLFHPGYVTTPLTSTALEYCTLDTHTHPPQSQACFMQRKTTGALIHTSPPIQIEILF